MTYTPDGAVLRLSTTCCGYIITGRLARLTLTQLVGSEACRWPHAGRGLISEDCVMVHAHQQT